jgi:hypothetical protein
LVFIITIIFIAFGFLVENSQKRKNLNNNKYYKFAPIREKKTQNMCGDDHIVKSIEKESLNLSKSHKNIHNDILIEVNGSQHSPAAPPPSLTTSFVNLNFPSSPSLQYNIKESSSQSSMTYLPKKNKRRIATSENTLNYSDSIPLKRYESNILQPPPPSPLPNE